MEMEQDRAGIVAGGLRVACTPSPNSMTSPSRTRLALRTNAHQLLRSSRLCSVAPTLASPRRPSSWAGMTRVSLNTSTSPGRRIVRQVEHIAVRQSARLRPAACAPHRAGARGEGRCGRAEGRSRKGRRALLRGRRLLRGSARARALELGSRCAEPARLPVQPARVPERSGFGSWRGAAPVQARSRSSGGLGGRRYGRGARQPPAARASGPPMLARTIRVGWAGGSPTAMPSTAAIPSITRPNALYLWSRLKRRREHDEELAVGAVGRFGARHRRDPANVRQVVELGRAGRGAASRPRRCPWDRRPGP